jgi:glucose 1-dehydrogenase
VAAGTVIFISSVHDLTPWAGHANCAAWKGGLMLALLRTQSEQLTQRANLHLALGGSFGTPQKQQAEVAEQ